VPKSARKSFDPRAKLSEVTFVCKPCRRTWDGAPDRVEDLDGEEDAYHPWAYFAVCSGCSFERAQAGWQRGLLAAWQQKPGPRTDEGKAAVRKNLEGHPTPEEAQRTRFNAMKTGLYARTAKYFPAKPDGYGWCTSCDVDRTWCAEQPACVKRAENFMLHHAAFDQRDPKILNGVYADLQAAIFSTIQQVVQTIIADGVKIVKPEYFVDKDGKLQLVEFLDRASGEWRQVYEISAHPLFKPLGELISRLGLSLTDMGITAKAVDARDEEPPMGQLAAADNRPALTDYQERQTKALEALVGQMARATEKTKRDPVLIEYQQQNGEASG
jgi:hypothetical protein